MNNSPDITRVFHTVLAAYHGDVINPRVTLSFSIAEPYQVSMLVATSDRTWDISFSREKLWKTVSQRTPWDLTPGLVDVFSENVHVYLRAPRDASMIGVVLPRQTILRFISDTYALVSRANEAQCISQLVDHAIIDIFMSADGE